MLVSDTPVEAHQALSVSPDKASGSPEAKPKIRVAHRRDVLLLIGVSVAGMLVFKNSRILSVGLIRRFYHSNSGFAVNECIYTFKNKIIYVVCPV